MQAGKTFVPGWHLDAVAEHLEAVSRGEIRRLVINVPPRHMKSLATCVFWPTWDWIDNPQRSWIFGSHKLTLATRDTVTARRLLGSAWYQSRWGCRCSQMPHSATCSGFRFTDDQNTKTLYENDRGGRRLATQVVPGPLGEGGDVLVIDDPHNPEEITSEAQREKLIETWEQVWMSRLNDPKRSAIVVIMQRLHERDLAGYLLGQGSGWEHLCLPTEHEVPPQVSVTSLGFRDPRAESGALLWPERVGDSEVAAEKKRGSYVFAAQHQQRPAPAGGGVLKGHWWRFWYPQGMTAAPPAWNSRRNDGSLHIHEQVELPAGLVADTLSLDCAFKDTATSSYVVSQAWARARARRFLIDQFREKLDFPSTVKAFLAQMVRHPQARARLVEDKANGPAVISTLKGRVAGLIAIEPDGSKESRAAAVSAEIEAGDVYLPHPALFPWVQLLLLEAATFPNGEYTDQIDALTQALRRYQQQPEFTGLAGIAGGGPRPEPARTGFAALGLGLDDDDFEEER